MRSLLGGLSVVLAIVLAGVSYSVRVSPESLSWLTYVWFAFPYLWLAVLVLCLLLILSRRLWLSVFCIAALTWTAPQFLCVLSPIQTSEYGEPVRGKSIKVLTYNVCFFGMGDLRKDREAALDSLAAYVEAEDADIICLQEGVAEKTFNKIVERTPQLSKVLERYTHRIISGTGRSGEHYVLSKYPVREVAASDALGTSDEGVSIRGVQIVDLTVPWGGSVRLFNAHLKSIGLSPDQIASVSEGGWNGERAERLKSTLDQMMVAFKDREHEVRLLSDAIANTRGSLIVCGDFNDTPISYTYETIMKSRTAEGLSLTDAFVGSGFGLGDTYRGKLPPIRIDYVLASEDLRLSSYSEQDRPTSDHCYVTACVSAKE